MGRKLTLVGAGGVAWSLAQALKPHFDIHQIYSRNHDNARRLAEITGGKPVDAPEQIDADADLYIVALADHAAVEVVNRIRPNRDAVWVHTSGSLPKEILSHLSDDFGVFYPLQTFSRGLTVDFGDVPLFVEGSNRTTTEMLMATGRKISSSVTEADSRLRGHLHIAGVLACNFVNHLWTTADQFLKADGLSIDVVKPLIAQTLQKISSISPMEAQTGPARRGDTDVMRRHMAQLSAEDAELYRFLSNRILRTYYPDDEQNRL